jgi:hypothetical protein
MSARSLRWRGIQIAFTILTGTRDGACASLKLKHIDIDQDRVDQDARQVKTKFSKSFETWFFPIGDDVRQVFVDWVTFLRQEKLWGLDDPLIGISRHPVWIASIGAAPVPFGRISRTPSLLRDCPISIRTAFARRSTWRQNLQISRGVQGLVSESRP